MHLRDDGAGAVSGRFRKGTVTPGKLLNEGVEEIGRVLSCAFVRTLVGLHLFHTETIDRLVVRQ